jgi:hypothetical protein
VTKHLSFLLSAALLVGAVIAALTWPGKAQQRSQPALQVGDVTAAVPVPDDNDIEHTAGLRIIHVPETFAPAPYPVRNGARAALSGTDVAPAPRPTQKRVANPASPQPRRILPPASEAKRTVLSVPSGSLSPVYPTPRWSANNKATTSANALPALAPSETSAPEPSETIDDDAPPAAD